MTANQGEMRETYPDAGEAYRYRMEAAEGSLTFDLEGETVAGSGSTTTLPVNRRWRCLRTDPRNRS